MISLILITTRRRRCTLAAITVCLGGSIVAVGPAQAAPAAGAQVSAAVQIAAAKPAGEVQANDVNPVKSPLPVPPEPVAAAKKELPLGGDKQVDVDLNKPMPAAG